MTDSRYSYHVERASAFLDLNRPAEAIPLLERALREWPDDSTVLTMLANAFWHLKDFARSLEAANRAVAADPESRQAHHGRCWALKGLGQTRAALTEIDICLRINPDDARHHADRVMLLLELGSTDEAELAAAQLVREWPDLSMAYAALACVRSSQNRMEEAAALNRRALAIDPLNHPALNNLARSLPGDMSVRDALADAVLYQGRRCESERIRRGDFDTSSHFEPHAGRKQSLLLPKLLNRLLGR
jgi:tetratricopeptide (TPR) repeat protein